MPLRHALKEWAVICKALATGRQAILLRKGGIAEPDGEFHLEHTRFWLYPTYVHQQKAGIKPQALPLLHAAQAERPSAGSIRIDHFAEVAGVYQVHSLMGALLVDRLHFWSEDTVRARFAYRSPGLFVLPVRIYRAAEVFELADQKDYAGCRSWVELGQELSTEGATPVLSDEEFQGMLRSLDALLNPTALA